MARYSRRAPGPMAPMTTAQQLAQDVARRNMPAAAPAAPAPASPAAPAMAAPSQARAPAVNQLAADIARGNTGTAQRRTTYSNVPDIPEQQPDLTPRSDRRPSLPNRPPPGTLAEPRPAGTGTGTSTMTLETAPGVLEGAYGGKAGPPFQSVTLETAPGALEGVDFSKMPGAVPAADTAPVDEEEAINQAIRDLITGGAPDVAAERAAMIDEMRANQARDIQSMRARTGLGGMGLTGAAGALESQVRQETGREQALTTAEFDRQARAEALDRLLKGVDLRRSEQVFEKAMDLFGKETEKEIPPLDGNGDGTITDEEREARRAAIAEAARQQQEESQSRGEEADAMRSAEVEGLSTAQFEQSINEKELKALGWTVEGPIGDDEQGRWYYEWTSPNGVSKRAYVDDAPEFASGGLEWA